MFLTRSPLGLPVHCCTMDLVRLACVKHAASVRPEPGSNSPSRTRRLLGIVLESLRRPGGISPNRRSDLIVVVGIGWESDPELTSNTTAKPPCCPHWRSVFSSVFKEHQLSACAPHGAEMPARPDPRVPEGARYETNGDQGRPQRGHPDPVGFLTPSGRAPDHHRSTDRVPRSASLNCPGQHHSTLGTTRWIPGQLATESK